MQNKMPQCRCETLSLLTISVCGVGLFCCLNTNMHYLLNLCVGCIVLVGPQPRTTQLKGGNKRVWCPRGHYRASLLQHRCNLTEENAFFFQQGIKTSPILSINSFCWLKLIKTPETNITPIETNASQEKKYFHALAAYSINFLLFYP